MLKTPYLYLNHFCLLKNKIQNNLELHLKLKMSTKNNHMFFHKNISSASSNMSSCFKENYNIY